VARTSAVTMDRSFFYWRGGLSILFGVLVLVLPQLTVLTFVTLVSIWLLLLGVMSIVSGIGAIGRGWGWIFSVLLGVLELGVGAYLVQRPGLTTLSIITLIGLVFFVQGFVHLANTLTSRSVGGGHRALSFLFAILSFAAGIWLWRYPFHGTLAFVWLVGVYAIIAGTMQVAMAHSVDDV
jgi:uncharacterized membrane protein HdeD (DUF308 family)